MSSSGKSRRGLGASAALLTAMLVTLLAAAEPAVTQEAKPSASEVPAQVTPVAETKSRLLPGDAVSQHSIALADRRLDYTATAGSIPLTGAKGETAARVFYVAYTLEAARARPITFVFNGGPGAASAFLNLGGLGPRVVNFTPDGSKAVEPVQLADNPDTWLEFTDLVFVDPVATGYSRTTVRTEEAERAYYGVEKDTNALASFVQLYLTRAGRLLAPLFLTGESYGGFRAAILASRLQAAGLSVQGMALVSPALEFSMVRRNPYALLPLALALPSLAAANLEMRDGPSGSLDLLADVERFARTDYLLRLASGFSSDPEMDRKLAAYTGLPVDVIARNQGRISSRLFMREYKKNTDRVLSSYDATVSQAIPRRSEDHFDPILDGSSTVLAAAFTQYVREELGFRTDLEYRLLYRDASGHWDYGTSATRQGFAGSLDDLQKARTRNPNLGVLIAHGYTDIVTPFAVSRYLVDQLAPIDKARPIDVKVYRGGHMMYFRPVSRQALARDARELYRQLTPAP